jgi:hypothetical protein
MRVNRPGPTSVDPPSTGPAGAAVDPETPSGERAIENQVAVGHESDSIGFGSNLLRSESHDPGAASAVPATALRSHSG